MNIMQYFKKKFLKQSFFIWIISVALIALLSMAYLSSTISEMALKEDVKRDLAIIANNKIASMENLIQDNKANVSLLAKNSALVTLINRLTQESSKGNNAAEIYKLQPGGIEKYLKLVQEQVQYKDIMIIANDGKIIFSLSQPQYLGHNVKEYEKEDANLYFTFKNAITLLEPQASTFKKSASSTTSQAYIASPIFAEKAIAGVLMMVMNNDGITKVVNNTEGLGKTGETIVGKFIDNKILPELNLRNVTIADFIKKYSATTDYSMNIAFKKASQGGRGEGLMTDYMGQEVMGAWRYLPSLGWGVLLKVDSKEIFAPIQELKKNIFFLSLFTFFLVVLVAYMVGRRLQKAETEMTNLLVELEFARDAALKSEQTKSMFIANMSHELRTPLNAIIGYSEILHEDAQDQGATDFLTDLYRITEAGKHLLGLINNILDFSKIESSKMDIYLEDISVSTLCEQVRSIIYPLIMKAGNTLEIICSPDLNMWHTDATKIRQCLLNLLSNANKFTQSGLITLKASPVVKDGVRWLQITIKDSGIGMTPEQQVNLFKAFSQADASTTRKFGGTGLGLFITSNFCQLLGGEIQVDSEIDKGTTFTILLPPLISAKSAKEMAVTGTPMVAASHDTDEVIDSSSKTVLIIDKEEETHLYFGKRFSKSRYKILHAYSTEEGLLLCKKHNPDMIVLDAVIIPKIEGWDELAVLKHDVNFQSTQVIMTSDATEENQFGSAVGSTEFLNHPILPEQLMKTLKKHTDGKKADILIVEDNPVMRKLLIRTLQKHKDRQKWQIREATNGFEALEALNEAIPSIILLDLMMPLMDGFEVVERLRINETWRHIPVVIITAKDLTTEDRSRLQGSGVKMVLSKGNYHHKELFDAISTQMQT